MYFNIFRKLKLVENSTDYISWSVKVEADILEKNERSFQEGGKREDSAIARQPSGNWL